MNHPFARTVAGIKTGAGGGGGRGWGGNCNPHAGGPEKVDPFVPHSGNAGSAKGDGSLLQEEERLFQERAETGNWYVEVNGQTGAA